MKYIFQLALLAAIALCIVACNKTTEQKAVDATADRLQAEAKEVKADAAATADVIKKNAVNDAAATKQMGDIRAEKLEKAAEQMKAAPTATPVAP